MIFKNSFHDFRQGETVSQVSREDILGQLHEPVTVGDVPDVEKGEVLVDSRGRGSLQR